MTVPTEPTSEANILRSIFDANASLPATVSLPPGDDMGAIRFGGSEILVAVDQLIDGRHVDLRITSPELVGRKTINRSLSDVAAMAARPICAVASAALPHGFGNDRARRLADGMRSAANAAGCPLVGGDIALHDGALICTATVLATPSPSGPVTRSAARPGEVLCVTGRLGDSFPSGRHLTFEPRIDAALELVSLLGPRLGAMIDISDGPGLDASRIADASNVSISIDAARLPCHAGATVEGALGDGEDYELLFTVAGDVPATIAASLPITIIGKVHEAGHTRWPATVTIDGSERDAAAFGWEHRDP